MNNSNATDTEAVETIIGRLAYSHGTRPGIYGLVLALSEALQEEPVQYFFDVEDAIDILAVDEAARIFTNALAEFQTLAK